MIVASAAVCASHYVFGHHLSPTNLPLKKKKKKKISPLTQDEDE